MVRGKAFIYPCAGGSPAFLVLTTARKYAGHQPMSSGPPLAFLPAWETTKEREEENELRRGRIPGSKPPPLFPWIPQLEQGGV